MRPDLVPPNERPVIKAPTWTPEIPLYFYVGGLAGASAGVGLLCELSGERALGRRAWAIAFAGSLAADDAFARAGLTRDEIDVVGMSDHFTINVLIGLEDAGFCKKGEGGAFVRSGALRMGGVLPTNTSGGQLSEAHVEGMLQIVEGARQLQGIYGPDRQVKDAEIALISGHGCNQVCHSTLILGRA